MATGTDGGSVGSHSLGTLSPALAAATAHAVCLAVAEQATRAARMAAAVQGFRRRLGGADVRVLTPSCSLPNTITCAFEVSDGRNLLPALDLAGVWASQGSACSAGSPTPPRVLQAMGLSVEAARGTVRFSFSHHSSIDDAVLAAARVRRVLTRMHSVG